MYIIELDKTIGRLLYFMYFDVFILLALGSGAQFADKNNTFRMWQLGTVILTLKARFLQKPWQMLGDL